MCDRHRKGGRGWSLKRQKYLKLMLGGGWVGLDSLFHLKIAQIFKARKSLLFILSGVERFNLLHTHLHKIGSSKSLLAAQFSG